MSVDMEDWIAGLTFTRQSTATSCDNDTSNNVASSASSSRARRTGSTSHAGGCARPSHVTSGGRRFRPERLLAAHVLISLVLLAHGAPLTSSVEHPVVTSSSRLDVRVSPKRSVLYPGSSVAIACEVQSWPRSVRTRIDIGFYYELVPDTSLPLSMELPGIAIWSHNEALLPPRTGTVLGGESPPGGRKSTTQTETRVLHIGKDAYKFLHWGNNRFYCTAWDRHSRTIRLDYFDVYKV